MTGRPAYQRVPFVLLPLALCLGGCLLFWHFTPDDTYITLQFARNLSEGNGLSFNPGRPTYGFTSPLWVLMLAPLARVLPDALTAAKLAGLLFSLASVLLFPGLAQRAGLCQRSGRWATIAWAADPYLWRWSLSGMETGLSAFIVIAVLSWSLGDRTRRRLSLLGVSAALLCLARPEGWLLAAVFLLLLLPSAVRERGAPVMYYAAGFLPLTGLWWLYSLSAFGRVLPNTAAAKGGLSLAPADWLRSGARFLALGLSAYPLETILASAFLIMALARRPRPAEWTLSQRTVLFLWPLTLAAAYALNGVNVISRYFILASPALVILGLLGLDRLGQRHPPKAALLNAALAAMLLSKLLLTGFISLPHTKGFSRGMDQCLIPAGRWLAANSPASSVIAVGDIGAIGYLSRRNILDLGALISPEVRPLRGRHTVQEILDRWPEMGLGRVDYVVDSARRPLRLLQDSPYRDMFLPRWTGTMPSLGVADTSSGWFYTIYQVNWDRLKLPEGRP